MPTVDWDARRAGAARPGRARGAGPARRRRRAPSSRWWRAGQTLGALGPVQPARSAGPLSPAEVDTAVEIGLRAGLALHHARLFGQQRDLADALQRSMLTDAAGAGPLADRRPLRAGRRRAPRSAATGTTPSCSPSGATVLAIGDVVGHDTRAAAAMGQVRGLLRGIGYSSGGSPAEVLTELDRAIEGLALDTMATALVARLEQDEDDLRAGQVRLRWSSAGHPAAGRARPPTARPCCWTTSRPTCCWAWRPSTERREHVDRPRRRASTVLLYTDGLVERRDRDLDAGTAELVDGAPRVRRPAAGRAVRRGARAAVPARRAGRRRHARLRLHPQDRAAAARRPGRRWCRRASSRRPTCIPEAGTEA